MNRTQAKARAAELGISKEVARQFGNLSKTQTWLDAIAAHEVEPSQLSVPLLESQETSETPAPVAPTSDPLCPDPWITQPDPVAEPQTLKPNAPQTSLVYPLLLILVLAWIACQLLLGLGSLLTVVLKRVAQQADHAATAYLVQLRTRAVTPVHAEAIS